MTLVLEGFEELDGIELFQKLPIFSGLNFDETMRLHGIARTERFGPGEVIVEQDTLGQALYVIRSGTVAVSSVIDGRTVPLGQMGAGELFGEMTLVDDVLTSARVAAAAEAVLFVLPRAEFDDLLARDRELAIKVYRAFCRTLSAKLRQLHGRLVMPESVLGNRGE